jgi:hypothetical protein
MSSIPVGSVTIKMPKIFVTGKKSSVALGDMKSVFKNRRIKQNANERAGGFRTIAFTGNSRDVVWNALKMIPWETDENTSKKRKAEAEEEGDGKAEKRSKKGKNVLEEVAFGDMF